MTFLYIFLGYCLVVWVGLRLVVPHLGFSKRPIPDSIPLELKQKIEELHQAASTDADFLNEAYQYVTSRYTGSRSKTVFQFWRAFGNALTKSPGFLPCTGQNFMLRTMLVKSGRFLDSDIQIKTVPFNLFIHQYLQVRVGDSFVDVDPWSHFLGRGFGKRSYLVG